MPGPEPDSKPAFNLGPLGDETRNPLRDHYRLVQRERETARERRPAPKPTQKLPRFTTLDTLLRSLRIRDQNLYIPMSGRKPLLAVEVSSILELPVEDRDFPKRFTVLDEEVVGAVCIAVAPAEVPGIPGIPGSIADKLNTRLSGLPDLSQSRLFPYAVEPRSNHDQPMAEIGCRQYLADLGQLEMTLSSRVKGAKDRTLLGMLVQMSQTSSVVEHDVPFIGLINVRMFMSASAAYAYATRENNHIPTPLVFDRNAGEADPELIPQGYVSNRQTE